MLNNRSTLHEALEIIRLAKRPDIFTSLQHRKEPNDFSEYMNLLITSKVDDKYNFIIKFINHSDFSQIETIEPTYKLAPNQNNMVSTFNQLFTVPVPPVISEKIDWNLRRYKFVIGEINSWSKDPSTKVSAALFDGKYPICSSYNGLPPGVEDSPERLNNREIKYKMIQHAEVNLISTCARLGIKTQGMTVAVSAFPCASCAGALISAGISELITVEPTEDLKTRWAPEFKLASEMLNEADVKVVIVKP